VALRRATRKLTREQKEAEESFAKMMAKWDKVPKFARTQHGKVQDTLDLSGAYSPPPGRESKRIPSRNTGEVVAGETKSSVYTGDKVVGIATLHKSISQPVFSQEEAISVAKMRRS
jgi:hypothetical protein